MIKPEELRINNWVDVKGKYSQVIAILDYNGKKCLSTSSVNFDTFELPFDEFEPIPLTPEILRGCGFSEALSLYIKNFSFLFYNRKGVNVSFNVLPDVCNVEYLHQLQNVFYCLTGEELTVNI